MLKWLVLEYKKPFGIVDLEILLNILYQCDIILVGVVS